MPSAEDARDWSRAVLRALQTPFPYASAHVSQGPDDVDVTPARLHPAFHGAFDWHSSVHMQWSAVRLLHLAQDGVDADTRDGLIAELDRRLTDRACSVEAAYLRTHPRFERPYGWGWASALAAATEQCSLPAAPAWSGAARRLFDVVAELVLAWLPRLAYPVRSGEHGNTAFGLALVHEAAGVLGRDDVTAAIARRARELYGADRGLEVAREPGGSDFLSPALSEADLMRRIMPADEYVAWLGGLLPGLGTETDPLLQVPLILDRADGKAVHLFGLALSRAFHLRMLSPFLDEDRRVRIDVATKALVASAAGEVVHGDYMSTHWLVSFALLACTSLEAGESR